MNYDAFMEPVSYFLTGMDKHSDKFKADALCNGEQFELTMRHTMTAFLTPSLFSAMNQLSNHDHSRFMTRTNHTPGRVATHGSAAASEGINPSVMKLGTMMLMTWPGAPTIYYGDEVGVCGFTDPDSRRTYPWGKENQELLQFHKDIIRLRKEHDELRTGSIKNMDCDYNYLAYGRFHDKGQCAILINNNDHPITRELNIWQLGIPKKGRIKTIFQSDENGYRLGGADYELYVGKITIELPKTSATILKYAIEDEESEEEE